MHIQLATKGGVVTAQITTQNEAVKNAIETQVVQLKDNLEEQGVKVEAVEVSVASHQMEKNLDQNGQDHQSQEQDKTTGSIRRIRRSNINLNLYNSDEEALEEAGGLDDADKNCYGDDDSERKYHGFIGIGLIWNVLEKEDNI